MSARSRHLITPREEFRVLWIETLTGLSVNLFVRSRFWAWAFLPHSIKKEPSLSLLMFFRVPAMAWKPFWIAKGDNFCRGRSLFADSTIKNLGQFVSLFTWASHCRNPYLNRHRVLFFFFLFTLFFFFLNSFFLFYSFSSSSSSFYSFFLGGGGGNWCFFTIVC